jgi:hypothetical protein
MIVQHTTNSQTYDVFRLTPQNEVEAFFLDRLVRGAAAATFRDAGNQVEIAISVESEDSIPPLPPQKGETG